MTRGVHRKGRTSDYQQFRLGQPGHGFSLSSKPVGHGYGWPVRSESGPHNDWELVRATSDLFNSAGARVDRTESSADFRASGHHIFDSQSCDVVCKVFLAQELFEGIVARWRSRHDSPNLLIVGHAVGAIFQLPANTEVISYDDLSVFLSPWIDTPSKASEEKGNVASDAKAAAANRQRRKPTIEDARAGIERLAHEDEAASFKADVRSIETWITTTTHLSERVLDNALSLWQRRGSNRGDHLWIVAEDITADAARRPLPGDIRRFSFNSLSEFLSQRPSAADSPRRPVASQKNLAVTVAADKPSIMAAVMGLCLTLRNRIEELKDRRSNTDEDHHLLDEYQALLVRVEALEEAIRHLDVRKPQKLEEAARGFWAQSGEWIAANHAMIMTSAIQGAFFTSIVGVLGLMKVVDPYTTVSALGIATGLSDKVIRAFGKRLHGEAKKPRKDT